jgi:DNA-binding CsgD family transcriptional regulator
MAANPDYLAIVEACYARATDDRAWLDRLLDSAGATLNTGPGFGLSLFQEQSVGVKTILSAGRGQVAKALPLSWPVLERMRGDAYRDFFYPRKPIVYANPIIATFNPVFRMSFETMLRLAGAENLLGMQGYPAPGWLFTLFMGIGRGTKIDPPMRTALERIRVHVESGLRLRLLGGEKAVAVLSTSGKVLHLANAETETHSAQLGHQAKSIDHGRTRAQRHDLGMRVWTALVDGRWSLVEHTDSDGQRHYLAFENTPRAQAYRALTERESIVVDQSIQGLAGRYIAYSTGLTPARISRLLTSAATKLGFHNRLELVRVASTLRSHGKFGLLGSPLTEAERDVWRLVSEGLTNAEIAKRRGTSVRTVVNQVANLFRKVGVRGRGGLVAAAGDDQG